jgi:hypothetical protein
MVPRLTRNSLEAFHEQMITVLKHVRLFFGGFGVSKRRFLHLAGKKTKIFDVVIVSLYEVEFKRFI